MAGPYPEYLLQSEDYRSICSVNLASLIEEHRDQLTRAERQVAAAVLRDPQAVAFGTLASVAEATGTSGTTIIRLAAKLGLGGFGELQAQAQEELAAQLGPRGSGSANRYPARWATRALAFELDNLQDTFGQVNRASFDEAARRLAECPGRVLIIAAECAAGIGDLLTDQPAMLRDGMTKLSAGTTCTSGSSWPRPGRTDTALVIDQRRDDRWVLGALKLVAGSGAYIISFSDSLLAAGRRVRGRLHRQRPRAGAL